MANVKISQLPTASAVTGDDFLPIVDSGSTTTQQASFQQVLDYVTGSTFNELTVGSLSASFLYVSASVIQKSGSTKFGDTSDDTHQFTGSVYMVGPGGGDPDLTLPNRIKIGNSFIAAESRLQGNVSVRNGFLSVNEDDFSVGVGSSRPFFVDYTLERVGVGTDTPSAKLDVSGSLIADVALSGAVGSEIQVSSYSLSAADRGKTLIFSSSATQGITCSSGLDVGFNSTFIQYGSGQLELSAASGVTILNRQSHTKTAGTYAAASVVIISSDVYLFSGDTSA